MFVWKIEIKGPYYAYVYAFVVMTDTYDYVISTSTIEYSSGLIRYTAIYVNPDEDFWDEVDNVDKKGVLVHELGHPRFFSS